MLLQPVELRAILSVLLLSTEVDSIRRKKEVKKLQHIAAQWGAVLIRSLRGWTHVYVE